MKVFLGGTCNKTTWRNQLVELLNENIDYFNPVVKDWTEECQLNELVERELSDYVLYVITPKMKGCYSIAEVVQDSNKRPDKTIFCVLDDFDDTTFKEFNKRSLQAVKNMVIANGAIVLNTLEEIADFLNNKSTENE